MDDKGWQFCVYSPFILAAHRHLCIPCTGIFIAAVVRRIKLVSDSEVHRKDIKKYNGINLGEQQCEMNEKGIGKIPHSSSCPLPL